MQKTLTSMVLASCIGLFGGRQLNAQDKLVPPSLEDLSKISIVKEQAIEYHPNEHIRRIHQESLQQKDRYKIFVDMLNALPQEGKGMVKSTIGDFTVPKDLMPKDIVKILQRSLRLPIQVGVLERVVDLGNKTWEEKISIRLYGGTKETTEISGILDTETVKLLQEDMGSLDRNQVLLSRDQLPDFRYDNYELRKVAEKTTKQGPVTKRIIPIDLTKKLQSITHDYEMQRQVGVSLKLVSRRFTPDLRAYREIVHLTFPNKDSYVIAMFGNTNDLLLGSLNEDPGLVDRTGVILTRARITRDLNVIDRIVKISTAQDIVIARKACKELKEGGSFEDVIKDNEIPNAILLLKHLHYMVNPDAKVVPDPDKLEHFCLEHLTIEGRYDGDESICRIARSSKYQDIMHQKLFGAITSDWRQRTYLYNIVYPVEGPFLPNASWYVPMWGMGRILYAPLYDKVRDDSTTVLDFVTSEGLDQRIRNFESEKWEAYFNVSKIVWSDFISNPGGFNRDKFKEGLKGLTDDKENSPFYFQVKHNLLDNFDKYGGKKLDLDAVLLRRIIVKSGCTPDEFNTLEDKARSEKFGKESSPKEAAERIGSATERYNTQLIDKCKELTTKKSNNDRFNVVHRGQVLWLTEIYEVRFPGGESSVVAFKVPIPKFLKETLDRDPFFLSRYHVTALDGSYVHLFNAVREYERQIIPGQYPLSLNFHRWLEEYEGKTDFVDAIEKRSRIKLPIEYLRPYVEHIRELSKFYDEKVKNREKLKEKILRAFQEAYDKSFDFYIGATFGGKGGGSFKFSVGFGGRNFTIGATADGKPLFGYSSRKTGAILVSQDDIEEILERLTTVTKIKKDDGIAHLFRDQNGLETGGHSRGEKSKDTKTFREKFDFGFDDESLKLLFEKNKTFAQYREFMKDGSGRHAAFRKQVLNYVARYAKLHDPDLLKKLDKISPEKILFTYWGLVNIELARNPLREIPVTVTSPPAGLYNANDNDWVTFANIANKYEKEGADIVYDVNEINIYCRGEKHYVLWRGQYVLPNGATYLIDREVDIDKRQYEFYVDNPGWLQRFRTGITVQKIENGDEVVGKLWEEDRHVQQFYFNSQLRNSPDQPTTVINQSRVINVKEEIEKMSQKGPIIGPGK